MLLTWQPISVPQGLLSLFHNVITKSTTRNLYESQSLARYFYDKRNVSPKRPFHRERSPKYTVQDRYSTVPEQLTARHRTVNIGSREQPGVAQS